MHSKVKLIIFDKLQVEKENELNYAVCFCCFIYVVLLLNLSIWGFINYINLFKIYWLVNEYEWMFNEWIFTQILILFKNNIYHKQYIMF